MKLWQIPNTNNSFLWHYRALNASGKEVKKSMMVAPRNKEHRKERVSESLFDLESFLTAL